MFFFWLPHLHLLESSNSIGWVTCIWNNQFLKINKTLAPFCNELTADGSAEFFFTQGQIECSPPVGFEDYFGPKPLYKFFEYDGIQKNDVLERVRDFPEGENAEDVLRELMPHGDSSIRQNIENALKAIYRTIEEHGPFDGICAYSEGTVAAGCLIMEEAKLFASEGRPRTIKRVWILSKIL